MFGKIKKDIQAALGILALLPLFYADFKASRDIGVRDFMDVKLGIARVETLLGHTPAVVATGTVIVPAPPAGHVLVPIPAEHVAALPDALASIIANVGAGISSAIPK